MLNSTPYSEKPSIMSFDKSTAIVWVAISLLLVETFSGALRFYLDQGGLGSLLYVPKILCCVVFIFELRTFKAGPAVWLSLLMLAVYGSIAMLHGASIKNVGFSLFGISPLLFGLVCSEYLIMRKRLFFWAIAFFLVASLIGVALDKYTSVPWKGYSYTIGETELSANTAWATDEVDRVAGFARVSNVLSILIAIYSLYVIVFLRSRLVVIALCGLAAVAIVLTTSKAPAAAFVLTLGLLMITRLHWTSRVVFFLAVVGAAALPLAGLLHDFDANQAGTGFLSSFYDRLINTWPAAFRMLTREDWGITGAGFGLFGSTLMLFPVPGVEAMGTDSTVMYLWATFGVVGILMFMLQIPFFIALGDDVTRMGRALLAITFCCCITGWTTDMFDVAAANLFMGMAIGHVVAGKLTRRAVISDVENTRVMTQTLPSLR
jgi:TM2 domain-containing membrane protein YozV